MATKIGLCVFLHNILNKNADKIPGQKDELRQLLKYEVKGKPGVKIFHTESGKTFDKDDLMNNPELLVEWLNNSSNENIEVK